MSVASDCIKKSLLQSTVTLNFMSVTPLMWIIFAQRALFCYADSLVLYKYSSTLDVNKVFLTPDVLIDQIMSPGFTCI